jgi:hypothetical protein
VQGPVMGGVYTSPYYATINSGTSAVPIICDDFSDESYLPETWTAYDTSLSQIPVTNPPNNTTVKWTDGTVPGVATPLTQSQAYTTAAYLAVEILETNQSTAAGAEAAGDLSYAMWGLFTPVVFTGQNGTTCSLADGIGCLSLTDYDAAEADLQNAWNAVRSQGLTTANFVSSVANVQSVTIYTYVPGTSCGGASCPPGPQEFISVTTPEVSTPVLMAVDLLGFMALLGFLRKRMARAV